jgi:hypothetical protein
MEATSIFSAVLSQAVVAQAVRSHSLVGPVLLLAAALNLLVAKERRQLVVTWMSQAVRVSRLQVATCSSHLLRHHLVQVDLSLFTAVLHLLTVAPS